MSKPRILLADDHMLILDGLRHLLERHYDLVGTVQDGHSVVDAARRLQPDLVLMDVAMPVLNGLQAGRRLHEQLPNIKLLYVSMYGDSPYVEEALRIGASGYVLKRSGWEELSRAIETVLAGKQYVSPELSAALPQSPIQPPAVPDGTMRLALDAALSSPSGLGVVVDDRQQVIGGVKADDVIAAIKGKKGFG